MGLFGAAQGQSVEVRTVVWPPCECGVPYAAHTVPDCPGYRPSRPVDPMTTRAYTPPWNWPIHRRAIGLALWAIERRCQQWRERLRNRS